MTHQSVDGTHSCGYHCSIPACIKAQRDYLAKRVGMVVQPQAQAVQAVPLTDEQVYWIAQSHGIGVHTCDVLGFYADLITTTGIVEPARGDVPASGKIKTGFCKLKAQPGGCPMDNLQCGWPDCDKGE